MSFILDVRVIYKLFATDNVITHKTINSADCSGEVKVLFAKGVFGK